MKNLTDFAGVALVFVYAIGSDLWFNTGDGWSSIPIAMALVPCQIWVAIAASLSYQYSKLN